MAKGKVSREGPSEAFTLPDTESNVDPDTAMVGDAGDGIDVEIEVDDDKDDWDVPPNTKKPAQQRDTGTSQDEPPAAEFDEEDSRLAYSDDPREQKEEDENRVSNRRRRNARRREAQNAAQAEIEGLKSQLAELGGVVRHLATGQTGLAANTLEGQIVALENSLRIADEEMANAVKNSDGDTYTKAQNIRDQIVGRLWNMKQKHGELMQSSRRAQEDAPPQRRDGGQAPQREAPPQIDPQVVAAVTDRFERFQDRFPWFDPESPDADCNIVRSIDTELVARGYQRHTPHFWEQMERKMATYGLTPNRERGEAEDDDPPPRRQQPLANGGRARPPTGNGRSTQTGRTNNGNTLSEVQVGMLRDEGLLEEKLSDEDVAKRDRILAKWRKGNESLRRGAR